MAITPQYSALQPRHQQHLGMGFQSHDAIHHLGANRLQHFGPVDIGLLVKARLELDHHRHLFAFAHRLAQQIHQGRIRTGAVNRLLDGQHIRVVDCGTQKKQDGVKAFKRLMQNHIAALQLLKHVGPKIPLHRNRGLIDRKTPLRTV